MTSRVDHVVVGAGIVGLATARAIQQRNPASTVLVLEKEQAVAQHQTGRNSGVVHSGIYYKPGSMKAQMCLAGSTSMFRYAEKRGIAVERCGKVIVATQDSQLGRLDALYTRGLQHGLAVSRLTPEQTKQLEPHVHCVGSIHVPSTGIIDYAAVCRSLQSEILSAGGAIEFGARVTGIDEAGGRVRVSSTTVDVEAGALANCAGLYSDVVAQLTGSEPVARIMPFRGEYFHVAEDKSYLVKNLIYPVPDPDLPFLGVHLTRSIHGGVHAGPNAVLALAREGYSWRTIRPRELWWAASYSGAWRLGRHYWRTGVDEVRRSLSRRRFAQSLQELVPEIGVNDLVPAPSGVRAQAVARDGSLVDDFSIVSRGRVVHVVNSPSPAATSALSIGAHIAAEAARAVA